MDLIVIEELRLDASVGVYEWERIGKQRIEFDLQIAIPPYLQRGTDTIEHTIDYAVVVDRLTTLLAEQRFGLLEALAEQVATILRKEFRSPWVRVAAYKPAMLRNARRVGVVIERGDPDAA